MRQELRDQERQALLASYNREIEMLHAKLLNGESWEHLKDQRRNVTELSIALHKTQYQNPEDTAPDHPAEFPQTHHISGEPVE